MKVGISAQMQFSLFGGGASGTSLAIAEVLKNHGFDVWLVNTHPGTEWWDDCKSLVQHWGKQVCTLSMVLNGQFPGDGKPFDLFIEVEKTILNEPGVRAKVAQHCVWLLRKSPLFHDIEASLFPFDNSSRNYDGLSACWAFSETCTEDDLKYLELITKVPASFVPYTWTPTIVETHRSEMKTPEWIQVAELTGIDKPWSIHICETNNSAASSCTIPLVVLNYVKKHSSFPIKKYSVHNAEHVLRSDFFKNNVKSHCPVEGISGEFIGRQRVADWIFDGKSCILSHSRFSQIRPYLLDAVWSGLPIIHNSLWIKNHLGGTGYEELYYADNDILQASECFTRLLAQFNDRKGIFTLDSRKATREKILVEVSSYSVHLCNKWLDVLRKLPAAPKTAPPQNEVASVHQEPPKDEQKAPATPVVHTVNILFTDMWDDFNEEYNMFTLMLNEATRHLKKPVKVVGHSLKTIGLLKPDLVIFGPFGQVWRGISSEIPKVHYTGENSNILTSTDIKMNIGYQHSDFKDQEYLRIPLWMLEIDWFGADKEQIRNPKPIPIDRCTKVYPEELARKQKFCAFVVTNPCNQLRNNAFQWLSQYKHVDSAGRLFNNVGDVIFAGLGGGGGELKKFEFLKDYKFCIAYENSSTQGYTTEKFLHAKAAGCIPIYWGDPKVERDFDLEGFIDARAFTTPQELIEAVRKVDENPSLWLKKYSVPALDENKRDLVRRTLSECTRRMLKLVGFTDQELVDIPRFLGATSDAEATELAKLRNTVSVVPSVSTVVEEIVPNKNTLVTSATTSQTIQDILLVTFANKRFLPSLHQWIVAINAQKNDPTVNISAEVWLGKDVPQSVKQELESEFKWISLKYIPEETTFEGFADFWDPQHYAWKLWILNEIVRRDDVKGKTVLYLDSGVFMCRWPRDYLYIAKEKGMCVLEDSRETNDRWCHSIFCSALNVKEQELKEQQIWAGSLVFQAGHPLAIDVFTEAWKWAQKREVIVGPKWAGVNAQNKPIGHRHDQSILSIVTSRLLVPRFPLDIVYCSESLRRTFMTGKHFYVHRGGFTVHKPFASEIDDCYVINLNRRKDRLEKLYTNSPELKDRIQRVTAVEGRTLQMTPAIARLFRPHDFNWKKPVLGCALSHLKVWWQLANERDEINSYLILEDDVKFKSGWERTWEEASRSIPQNTDVIYLGGILPPNRAAFETVKEKINPYFSKVKDNTIFGQNPPNPYFHWCAYAYVLTKAGARKILEVLKAKDGYWTSADHMICNLTGILNMVFLDPLVAGCYQDDDPRYQNAAFNDFSRVDGFDSDLWNNTECFPKDDSDALARMNIPIDIASALNDASQEVTQSSLDIKGKKEESVKTTEDRVGSESNETAKKELVILMTDELPDMWKQIFQHINKEENLLAIQLLFSLLEEWKDEYWTIPTIYYVKLLSLFQNKTFAGLPNKDILKKLHQKSLFLLEQCPESKKEPFQVLGESIEELIKFSFQNVDYSKQNQKKRIVAFRDQGLDFNALYESAWLREIFGDSVSYDVEPVDLETPVPTDVPIVVFQRPYCLGFLKVLEKWKEQNAKFYLLHLSDETAEDPVFLYGWDECLGVIRMYFREDTEIFGGKVLTIPLGYHFSPGNGGIDPNIHTPRLPFRQFNWSFLGTDWNNRQERMKNLNLIQPHFVRWFNEWKDPQMLQRQEYLNLLLDSKFVPTPGGVNPETYRFYEALETGCIPLYVREKNDSLFVEKQLGKWLPIANLPDWDHAAGFMFQLLNNVQTLEQYRMNILERYKLWKLQVIQDSRKLFSLG